MTREDRIAELLGAWQERREAGVFEDPESVIAAHPDLADELRAHFLAAQAVEQAYAETRFLRGDAPRRIGDYEIVREVGRGGMGIVYEAFQTSMRRRVALKVLFPAVTHSKHAVRRFQREARTAGRLQHTNIVPVYALGSEAGVWFYAMELIEGDSLAHVLKALRGIGNSPGSGHETILSGRVIDTAPTDASADEEPTHEAEPPGSTPEAGPNYYRRVASMFAGVADALASAHTAGVIHRDVKPSNLMLDRQGRLKLLDFGLARMIDGSGGMTVTGEVIGTPVYMSPEQARARADEIDHRTDVYSLGATLYEMLTLRPPFAGGEFAEVYRQILTTDPLSPRSHNGQIPKDLETIVLKAMEKEPSSRYADAGDLTHDLRAFAEGRSIGARRVGPVERLWRKAKRHKALTTASVLLLGALLTALLLARRASEEEARRRMVEYELLVQEATAVLPRDHGAGEARGGVAASLFERAVAIDPERTEAYVGLALTSGRSAEQRLAAVASAEARGIAPSTAVRLRAAVLHEAGRRDEARAAEDGLPEPPVAPEPLESLLLGIRAHQRADTQVALAYLANAVAGAPPDSLVAYVARRTRAPLLARLGRLQEALDDLQATRARGDRGIRSTVLTASLWRRLGQTEKAESLIEATLEGELLTAPAWHVFLEECQRQGERAWAERAGERGVAAHPDDGPLRALHGFTLSQWRGYREALALQEEGARLQPDDGRIHALLALTRAELGMGDAARASIERAVELAPDDPWVRQLQAGVLRVAHRLDEAYAATDRVLELDPNWPNAHEMRAAIRREQGRLGEALESAEVAVGMAPTRASAHDTHGTVLRALGRKEDAVEAHARAVALAPDVPTFHYNLGCAHFELRDFEAALRSFECAAAERPDFKAAVYFHAHTLGHLDRYEEALEGLQRVQALDPEHEARKVWTEIGMARWALGQRDAALDALRHALDADPEFVHARANLAGLLMQLGQHEQALTECDRALAQRPDLGVVWHHKGEAHRALGEPQKALEAYAQAGLHLPGDPDPHSWSAMLLEQLDRDEEALAEWRKAAEVAPHMPHVHYNLALTLAQRRQMEGAEKVVRTCLDLDDAHAAAHHLLGQILSRRGEHDAAIAALRRSVALDGGHEVVRLELAKALLRDDRWAEAADVLDQATRDFPEHGRPPTWLAMVLTTAPDESVRAPERAVELTRMARMLQGGGSLSHAILALALHQKGRHREALEVLNGIRTSQRAEYMATSIAVLALCALGEKEQARERLEASSARPHPEDIRVQTKIEHRLRREAESALAE